jgi:hypothetical protein
MLSKRQALFAQNVAKLIAYCAAIGKPCTLGEAYRTQEQAAIYAKEGKGIKNSLHCQRLAIDLNLFSSDYTYHPDKEFYKEAAEFWESLHECNRAGYYFPNGDADHFEMMDNDGIYIHKEKDGSLSYSKAENPMLK